MTREEALQYGHLMLSLEEDKESAMCDFITTAIKALEQEPCEDVISRQAVKELYYKDGYIDFRKICELPPVTPAEKAGHFLKMLMPII